MKKTVLISVLILLLGCKTQPKYETLEYTIINKNIISDFQSELKMFPKIEEFKNRKVNFIALKKYSIGSVKLLRANDINNCLNCISPFSIYLIWKEHENQYIQIFDNCGNFLPLEVENKNILDFANTNFNIINSEKIKYYQEDKKTISLISHSSFSEFLISKNGMEIYNYFDIYNLRTNSEKPNLNYEYNQNLKIVKLNNLIEEEIEKKKKNGSFKRDLTK